LRKTRHNILVGLFNPLLIIILVWIMTICTYAYPVSYDIPNNISKLLFIAVISIASFVLAYFPIYLYTLSICKKTQQVHEPSRASRRRLRAFLAFATLICLAIVSWTLVKDGLFPFMKVIGYEVKDYQSFGRFKGILFPMMFVLFMVSSLERRRTINWGIKLVCLLIAWLYVSRASIAFMGSQYVFFLIISGKYKRIKNFKSILVTIILLGIIVVGYLGEIRTGDNSFRRSMQIKHKYKDIPATFLWFSTYISMPSVNLLSVVENCHTASSGKMLFNSCLPVPVQTEAFRNAFYKHIPNPYNNAPTYLAYAFIDFSWYGILLVNMAYGALGGIFFARVRRSPSSISSLYYAVYLSALGLSFFAHMLFFFPILLEFLLIRIVAGCLRHKRALSHCIKHTVEVENVSDAVFERSRKL